MPAPRDDEPNSTSSARLHRVPPLSPHPSGKPQGSTVTLAPSFQSLMWNTMRGPTDSPQASSLSLTPSFAKPLPSTPQKALDPLDTSSPAALSSSSSLREPSKKPSKQKAPGRTSIDATAPLIREFLRKKSEAPTPAPATPVPPLTRRTLAKYTGQARDEGSSGAAFLEGRKGSARPSLSEGQSVKERSIDTHFSALLAEIDSTLEGGNVIACLEYLVRPHVTWKSAMKNKREGLRGGESEGGLRGEQGALKRMWEQQQRVRLRSASVGSMNSDCSVSMASVASAPAGFPANGIKGSKHLGKLRRPGSLRPQGEGRSESASEPVSFENFASTFSISSIMSSSNTQKLGSARSVPPISERARASSLVSQPPPSEHRRSQHSMAPKGGVSPKNGGGGRRVKAETITHGKVRENARNNEKKLNSSSPNLSLQIVGGTIAGPSLGSFSATR